MLVLMNVIICYKVYIRTTVVVVQVVEGRGVVLVVVLVTTEPVCPH